ncbi:unnamed protein product [Prorocentrum cordatum]|uniref:Uncharacterized protein n=1 Tax=Prorocentrum cordatum TaxID=2364126 RepID=A0ABN9X3L2_9DINO|nr:unnamed protein product [Polarella glacialis]
MCGAGPEGVPHGSGGRCVPREGGVGDADGRRGEARLVPVLTRSSSFEDFQRFLHGHARFSDVCPEPCAAPARKECHTAVEGDACHEKVVWAMQTGVVEKPDWYPSLTRSSSFEDFQRFLHGHARFSDVCPEPCAAPARKECHTAVEGDACHEKVVWAMQTGVVEKPDWYPSLTRSSSFEDFQRFLHGHARFSDVCPEPCAAPARKECHTAVEGDACHEKVVWAMQTGVVEKPDWYPSLTRSSSFEDFQRFLHGHARFSDVCPEPCAAPARKECHTAVEGDACHEKVVWAMQTGVVEKPDWYPSLTRSSSFEDFQRFLHGHARFSDVCPEPCAAQDATDRVRAESFQTSDPPYGSTPSPAPIDYNRLVSGPESCDVTDGSSPSSVYPCMCGSDLCAVNQICSGYSCAPIEFLRVEWPCSNPGIGSSYFSLSGVSANGAPVYTNSVGNYIYWDASCDGSGSQNQDRWIMDVDAPNVTAPMDLDSSLDCTFMGYHGTPEFFGVPLGNSTWTVACDGAQSDTTVAITHVQVIPTPGPTLEPGLPCACATPCGGFVYVDTDGDGCIEYPECMPNVELAERLPEMDADGDGCVTEAECDLSPWSYLLPNFAVAAPECDEGSYVAVGTSVCQQCPGGETRRRRATTCTECPLGRAYPPGFCGHLDDCIAGAYLMGPVSAGGDVICASQDIDEGGALLTVGVRVTIVARALGHFQSLTIEDITSRTNGTVCFRMSGPAVLNFSACDPVIETCSGTSGLAFSDSYPCGCGTVICQDGERCDFGSAGNDHGQGGYCIGPGPGILRTPSPTVSAKGDPHLVNLLGEHFDVNHGGEFTLLRIPQDAGRPAEMELKASVRPESGRPCTTYITQVELSGAWLGGKVVQVRSYKAKAKDEAGKFLGLRVMNSGVYEEAQHDVPWEKLADWTDMTLLLSEYQGKTGFMVTLAKTQWRSRKAAREGASSVAGQVEVRFQRRRLNESAQVIMRQDLPMQEHLNLAVRHIAALGRSDVGGLLGFDPHPESLEAVTPECQRHRDGLDGQQGPRFRPNWKIRWEKIREQRGRLEDPHGGTGDNQAAASLMSTRAMMCVCASAEAGAEAGAGGGGVQGVLAELQTGRLAEATWD